MSLSGILKIAVKMSPTTIKITNAKNIVSNASPQLGIPHKYGFLPCDSFLTRPIFFSRSALEITKDLLFLSLLILNAITTKRKIIVITISTIAFVLLSILLFRVKAFSLSNFKDTPPKIRSQKNLSHLFINHGVTIPLNSILKEEKKLDTCGTNMAACCRL